MNVELLDKIFALAAERRENVDEAAYVDDLLRATHQKELYELEAWCDETLITSRGDVDAAACNGLEQHGYRVGPGETDSFGWLTGVISKNGMRFVFG